MAGQHRRRCLPAGKPGMAILGYSDGSPCSTNQTGIRRGPQAASRENVPAVATSHGVVATKNVPWKNQQNRKRWHIDVDNLATSNMQIRTQHLPDERLATYAVADRFTTAAATMVCSGGSSSTCMLTCTSASGDSQRRHSTASTRCQCT